MVSDSCVTSGAVAEWSRLRKTVLLPDGTERTILDFPAASIPRGRLTCVLGPSGSGKTTFLGIVGLVDRAFEGDLVFNLAGRSVAVGRMKEKERAVASHGLRRHLGYIFQEIRLRQGATALENVIDPLTYLGCGTRQERWSFAGSMLELFGIGAIEWTRPVSSFSGGMQQRTALARALSVGPELICADEPTAHVDAVLADSIYKDLKNRAARNGVAVLVATHDERLAFAHADQIFRIECDDSDSGCDGPIPAGQWRYKVTVERQAEPSLVPHPQRLVATGFGGRVSDMARAGIREFAPLGRVSMRAARMMTYGWLMALAGLFRKSKSKAREPIPGHTYMPQLISIVTFALLAAMSFSFQGMKSGIVAFEQGMLNDVKAARRVRVVGPSQADGRAVPLDLADLQRFVNANGVNLQQVQPNFRLDGAAARADDVSYTRENEGRLSYPMELALDFRRSGADREDAVNRRFQMAIFPGDPGEPLSVDRGVPQDGRDYSDGQDGDLPGLLINDEVVDWIGFGQFPDVPRPGDEVAIMFRTVSAVRQKNIDGQPESEQVSNIEPNVLCLNFRVAGYLDPPRAVKEFVGEVVDPNIHAIMRRSVFQKILVWQHDPLGNSAGSEIPEKWRCPGSVRSRVGLEYETANLSRKPGAPTYDLIAETPEDALLLPDVVQKYGLDRKIQFRDVVSEKEFIQKISLIVAIARAVGFIIQLLPMAVAGVVLWLVVHGMIQKRREELLLFLTMGAPSIQLHIQCLVMVLFIVVPGLAAGFLSGTFAPAAAQRFLAVMPGSESVAPYLANFKVGWTSLVEIGLTAIVCACIASISVVRSITSTNPADAFRGTR